MDDLTTVIKELVKKRSIVDREEESLAYFDQVSKPPQPQGYYASVELLQAYLVGKAKYCQDRDELVTRLEIDRMSFYELQGKVIDALPSGVWVNCEGYNLGVTRFRSMGFTNRRLEMIPVGSNLPELL